MDLTELKALIIEHGQAWDNQRKGFDTRLAAIEGDLAEALQRIGVSITSIDAALGSQQARQARSALLGGGTAADQRPAYELITKDGKRIPALTRQQSVADYARGMAGANPDDESFSLGEWVKQAMLGQKVTSGPALVPNYVGGLIIDDVRARNVLVQAGAVTIPIDGPTTFARIAGDPTVVQHAEAVNDIVESNPTFVPVAANPGTLAALIPLSLEVVQDSPNLDDALRTSLASAFASKLDHAGLTTILADNAIPESTVAHDPADFTKVALAVGAAMAANQPLPAAAIVNAVDFVTRHSVLADTAGTWLGKPPFLADMREVPTTNIAAGTSILGDFTRGVGIALRAELTVEVLRYGKPTYGMHYLIAVMRAAAIVLQPKALFIELKTPA